MCIPNNLPLMCKSLPLYGLPNLCVVTNKSCPLPLPMSFSFTNASYMKLLYAIHENHVSTLQLGPYFHVHGNLMPHYDLASLATLLCWAFL